MTDEPGKQLVPIRPGGALQTTSGAARVVSTAVSDALSIAKTKTQKLIEIGGYQFNEESYKQLQIWAEEIEGYWDDSVSLAELVGGLASHGNVQWVGEGWLKHIQFDFWPTINWKNERIDLSHAPQLRSLYCCDNHLKVLDLSHTPELTDLYCGSNHLTELYLSHTPRLTRLDCRYNRLGDELALWDTPRLTDLWCSGNDLTDLWIYFTPRLTRLDCSDNQLPPCAQLLPRP